MKYSITKTIITAIICLLGFTSITPIFTPTASAAKSSICDSNKKDVPPAIWEQNNCDQNADKNDVPNLVTNILNAIIGISGLVAVVFIIIGGVQYMTSTGDTGKLEKAKKTILYALIGLGVCALAFAIVNFVITNIIGQK